jgi:DGQHR domain-containing protein
MAKKPKKPKLSKEQLAENRKNRAKLRAFNDAHRNIFLRAGFQRLPSVDGINFTFDGLKGEIDDIFVYENVVVFAEYTTSNSANLSTHVKGKAGMHNKLLEKPIEFLHFFSGLSTGLSAWMASKPYTDKQLIFVALYGSIDAVEGHHKALFDSTRFMSESERYYFRKLTNAVKKSARFEIFEYFGIDPSNVGAGGVVNISPPSDPYFALALPEEQSHFPSDFKVISFYVDPDALLRRSYVLRRNGWRDGIGLYQRLIIPAKISSIRAHLKEKKRVFANNIVLTLPDTAKMIGADGKESDLKNIVSPTQVKLELPRIANSIGIVDGQHRVFSYYEDVAPDQDIDAFRVQQNLLATGIVYPKDMPEKEREKFEAGLFLEINSNQASASSDIIQAIWMILDPFRAVSVAGTVVSRLSNRPPLAGKLARTSLDAGRIKTASIVAYGIQPLTKRTGTDSLFYIWDNKAAKDRFKAGAADEADLESYIEFSVEVIANFLNNIRSVIGNAKWKTISKDGGGVLSVTTINGFIILLRKLIESGSIKSKNDVPDLQKLSDIDFKSFKSSQYADLAKKMMEMIK